MLYLNFREFVDLFHFFIQSQRRPNFCYSHAMQRLGNNFLSLSSAAILCACGGGGEFGSVARKVEEPVRQVAMSDVPGLSVCLAKIDRALQKSSKQSDVSLDCATGAYAGLTHDGRLCSLRVDGAMGSFEFQVEHEKVDILWTNSAIAADGRPIHNLEDASTATHPGVMLTKFTGAIEPVSEALILQMSGTHPVLPKMIYQRFEGSSARSLQCNFGA